MPARRAIERDDAAVET
ncbi:hypothetical protein [Frankia sp. AiPs1]